MNIHRFNSFEKMKRVIWTLREGRPDKKRFTYLELRRATDKICGLDLRTYKNYKALLVRQGLIRADGKRHFVLTKEGLSDDIMADYNFARPPPRESDFKDVTPLRIWTCEDCGKEVGGDRHVCSNPKRTIWNS